MPTLYLILASAILSGAMGFGGAWKVQSWRFGAAEKERIEQEARAMLRRQDNAIDASVRYQADQAEANAREVEIIREVVRIVQKPVYREQCLDDDGMRIIAADIQAANARRGLSPALPASAGTK